LLIGSSFGGAVAVELLQRQIWRGPTLLLAQAALRQNPAARLPDAVPVWLVHGLRDELIDPEDSRRLAATGSAAQVRLFEVDDDHALRASVADGALVRFASALLASQTGAA
jgi:predicted esterase